MKHLFDFLTDLKKNNNREWFNDHKDRFQEAKLSFDELVGEVCNRMQSHDAIDVANTKIFRIYRDTRFSKDKTPYKTWFAANIKREGKANRGGYYLKLEPGDSFAGGGFYGPNPKDLLHMRRQISGDPDPLRKAVEGKKFKGYYGEMLGEQVKTAPKGFEKDDPAIDLLKHKSFYFMHNFSDEEVLDGNFVEIVDEGYRNIRPFFDAMSEYLTTDLNGNSIL